MTEALSTLDVMLTTDLTRRVGCLQSQAPAGAKEEKLKPYASTVADIRKGGALWHDSRITTKLAGCRHADCFLTLDFGDVARGSLGEMNAITTARRRNASRSGNTRPGQRRLL